MELLDSRRLTGPGLVLDRPGAVADVRVADAERDGLIAAWREAARRMLAAVGWVGERTAVRLFTGGASLAITAPPDSLYAATDLVEWAWAAAVAAVVGQRAPEFGPAVERLREAIAAERNPALLAIREAARARGLTFLSGEDVVSVGAGTGVLVVARRRAARPRGNRLVASARDPGRPRDRLQRQDDGHPAARGDDRRGRPPHRRHQHRRRAGRRQDRGRG